MSLGIWTLHGKFLLIKDCLIVISTVNTECFQATMLSQLCSSVPSQVFCSQHVSFIITIYRKDGVWVDHLFSGYSLPMEEPSDSKEVNSKGVAGTWRKAIKIAFETTRLAFPGGEVLARLDLKSVNEVILTNFRNYVMHQCKLIHELIFFFD